MDTETTGLKRILLVEDCCIASMELEEIIRGAGYLVEGCAGDLSSAISCLNAFPFDAAVVDVSLNGTEIFAVARELSQRTIPLIISDFTLSRGPQIKLPRCVWLEKPINAKKLLSALAEILLR